MSPKSFLALLVLTLASIGLAGYSLATRDVPEADVAIDRPLLPDLADRLDQVATIEVRTANRSMTARRQGDEWVVVEKDNYPADPEKVRRLVLGLAEMRILEAKTRDPERLARLELEPVDKKDAKSREVTLRTSDGTVLAKVVVGKRKYSLFGPGKSGSYVRLADSNQAWLVDRSIEVPEEPLDWFDRTILSLPSKQVAEVVLRAGSPEALHIRRSAGDPEHFELVELPEGRRADPSKLSQLAGTLGSISMLDVRPEKEKPLPEDAPKARFASFDGLEIEVTVGLFGEGDKQEYWLRFEPRKGAARPRPGETAGKPQAAQANEDKGQAKKDKAEAKGSPSVEERVAGLRKRLQGRVFKVSPYLAKRLVWKVEDLLEPPGGAS